MENKKKIMIADDNDFFSKILMNELGKQNLEVIIVNNGQEVLDQVDSVLPDLILLDLIMPIKDGFETITELRSNPKYKDIKIIIFSNLAQKQDVDKAMSLGADGYIVKKDASLDEMIKNIVKFI